MTEVTFPPSHQSSEAQLGSRWLNRPKITVLRARKKIVKLMYFKDFSKIDLFYFTFFFWN